MVVGTIYSQSNPTYSLLNRITKKKKRKYIYDSWAKNFDYISCLAFNYIKTPWHQFFSWMLDLALKFVVISWLGTYLSNLVNLPILWAILVNYVQIWLKLESHVFCVPNGNRNAYVANKTPKVGPMLDNQIHYSTSTTCQPYNTLPIITKKIEVGRLDTQLPFYTFLLLISLLEQKI